METGLKYVFWMACILLMVFLLGYSVYPLVHINEYIDNYQHEDSAQEFITECNALYGVGTFSNGGNWTVIGETEFASHTPEFYWTHPVIYIGGLGSGESYSCYPVRGE